MEVGIDASTHDAVLTKEQQEPESSEKKPFRDEKAFRDESSLRDESPLRDENPRVRYIMKETEQRERAALRGLVENKKEGVRCQLCTFTATCLARLRIHTRQHLINQVCGCGEMSHRRDTILKHIAKERSGTRFGDKGCRDKLVYEVDAASFAAFKQKTGNPAVEFLPLKPCSPTTDPEATEPSTTKTTSAKTTTRDSAATEQAETTVTRPPKTESQVEVKPVAPVSEAPTEPPTENSETPATAPLGSDNPLSRRERKEAKRVRKEEKRERKRAKKLAKRLAVAINSVQLPPTEEPSKKTQGLSSKKTRASHQPKIAEADRFPRQMTDLRRRLNRRKEDLATLRAAALTRPINPAPPRVIPATAVCSAIPPFPALPQPPMSYANVVAEPPPAAVAGQAPAASTQQAGGADQTYITHILEIEADSLELYRWVRAHYPYPMIETHIDNLIQKISHARRHAVATTVRPATNAAPEYDDVRPSEAKRRRR